MRRRSVSVAMVLAFAVSALAGGCTNEMPPGATGQHVTLVWYCWNGIYYPRDPAVTPRYWAGWSPAPSADLDIRRRDDGGFETTGVIRLESETTAVFTADSGAVLTMRPQDPGMGYPAVCHANPAS